jgi:hypothetical protein
VVEHVLGKDEATGSIPVNGSSLQKTPRKRGAFFSFEMNTSGVGGRPSTPEALRLEVAGMRVLVLLAFAVAPASAQAPAGMGAMQYYAGAWACSAPGEPDSNATATYTIENGVMRDSVVVPAQGKMTAPYELAIVTTFDAKHDRYMQTSLDNQAEWAVSFAKPFTGNTEEWVNNVTNDGKLGHVKVVRTDRNDFDIIGYSTMSQTKPDYTVICHRS